MSVREYRPLFQTLAEGANTRHFLDDLSLSLSSIFQNLAFQFNNKDIVIKLPDNSDDVDGVSDLDPNDFTLINNDRDCKLFYLE